KQQTVQESVASQFTIPIEIRRTGELISNPKISIRAIVGLDAGEECVGLHSPGGNGLTRGLKSAL
ncbi:MAG: hypothetical protein ACRCXD_13195, partial [Luteolibacter sp.]